MAIPKTRQLENGIRMPYSDMSDLKAHILLIIQCCTPYLEMSTLLLINHSSYSCRCHEVGQREKGEKEMTKQDE